VSAAKPPLGQVSGEWRKQSHRARLACLGGLDAALAVSRLLDQERPLANVRPAERLRLLRTKPGIRENRDQGCVSWPMLPSPSRSRHTQALDSRRGQRPHLAIAADLRLLHGLDRVVRNPSPLDGAAQNTLKLHECAVHGRQPHSVRFQFGPVALHNLGRDRVERHGAESRLYVAIPQPGVAAQSARCQVRDGVELPPLFGKLGQGFPAAGEQVEISGALAPHDLGLE